MLVYQGVIEYFMGSNSGYGTVRTKYGNVFSDVHKCIDNIRSMSKNMSTKTWYILKYNIDSEADPICVRFNE